MAKISRRAVLNAAVAASLVGVTGISDTEEAWPHPHIGADAIPKGWRPGVPHTIETRNVPMVITGIFIMNDHVLSRGRLYTEAEYALVKDDLKAYLDERNPVLTARGERLVQEDWRRNRKERQSTNIFWGSYSPD